MTKRKSSKGKASSLPSTHRMSSRSRGLVTASDKQNLNDSRSSSGGNPDDSVYYVTRSESLGTNSKTVTLSYPPREDVAGASTQVVENHNAGSSQGVLDVRNDDLAMEGTSNVGVLSSTAGGQQPAQDDGGFDPRCARKMT